MSHLRITSLLGIVKKWGGNRFKGGISFENLGACPRPATPPPAPVGRQVAAIGVNVWVRHRGLGKVMREDLPQWKPYEAFFIV